MTNYRNSVNACLQNNTNNGNNERRRTSMEIVADILRIAKKGARKTRVVYGANLNFKLLEKYLDVLNKSSLIEQEFYEKGVIQTSEKGEQFLKQYETLAVIIHDRI